MEVHQAEDKRDHKLLPPSCGNYYYCVALRQFFFEWKDGLVSVKQCFSLFGESSFLEHNFEIH